MNDDLPRCLSALDALRAADLSGHTGNPHGSWSPDLPLSPSLWEIFSSGDELSADALALALGQMHGNAEAPAPSWLWVQDADSMRRSGRPFLHGLPAPLRPGLIHVQARHGSDALWAMEEGVRCGAMAFVVGELWGDPKSLDFTATRRLVLAAERSGVPLLLLRREGTSNLSAARLRWRTRSAPAQDHRWNPQAPGSPTLEAELYRGRGFRPGTFLLSHGEGHEPGDRLHLVSDLRDRPLEPDQRAAG
ncbi:ImuA family protein [Sphingomicrobium lutaoense]|uniref:Protein ImuA n=1 Tax=Sphingomicrobium lutaoense TaxID=515949 RepID=A0A839YYY6_9SPHN|nr:hypothetical protein [Sphingomicrobium lutaoense]MBB3763528.1 protein ImuA [Sphingomicrobium lutaoense]